MQSLEEGSVPSPDHPLQHLAQASAIKLMVPSGISRQLPLGDCPLISDHVSLTVVTGLRFYT